VKLREARSAMNSGDHERALRHYGELMESGANLSVLIGDLETAAGRYSRQPLITRLLGDAYMRNGQLQKALDMYRRALDQM
jgi:uncharacterized protein HemY